MDRLVALLNEYEKDGLNEFETYVERWYCERTEQILSGKWENNNELKPCEIISKKYGFIQWLVENEKIDLDMIPNVFTSSAQDRDEVYYCMRDIKDFSILNEQYGKPTIECLLMLLSIQDNPIEFLISVLR